MADENDGTAYLRALKRSTDPPASAVAAPNEPTDGPGALSRAVKTSPPVRQIFKGSDKRRSARYKCEGSVEAREEGCDVRTWAKFTDISLHGCYVEAQATYPPGTFLHMQLEANGIKFQTKGSVRVTYPYLGMGIAFVDMTEENTLHLRRLLASISHPRVTMGPGAASSLSAAVPLASLPNISLPIITEPLAAIEALIEFFQNRQMLMRDEFVRIVKQSQK
jgi:hypothetical protein